MNTYKNPVESADASIHNTLSSLALAEDDISIAEPTVVQSTSYELLHEDSTSHATQEEQHEFTDATAEEPDLEASGEDSMQQLEFDMQSDQHDEHSHRLEQQDSWGSGQDDEHYPIDEQQEDWGSDVYEQQDDWGYDVDEQQDAWQYDLSDQQDGWENYAYEQQDDWEVYENEQQDDSGSALNESEDSQTCAACEDDLQDQQFLAGECVHRYCDDCLEHFISTALNDRTIWPPRCCQNQLNLELAAQHISPALKQEVDAKQEELFDLDATYCSKRDCCNYLASAVKNTDRGVCLQCGTSTCLHCKEASHGGGCVEDEGRKQVQKLALEQGWSTCARCKNVVERTFGCNHMTCRCGNEYCYQCGLQWRTCKCSLYDENAERPPRPDWLLRIDERNAARERLYQTNLAAVRARTDCNHGYTWLKHPYRTICQLCGDEMSRYLFRCQNEACALDACRQCAQRVTTGHFNDSLGYVSISDFIRVEQSRR